MLLAGLDLDKNFMRGFVQQKQTAEQQDQVAPADALPQQAEQISRQAHDPAQREQQQQTRDHGKAQPQPARLVAQMRRQSPHQNRDEDDVVNAQHNFQGGQHRKGDPDIRVR